MAKASNLIGGMEREGYKAGAPARVSAEAQRIDAEVCRETACPKCKTHGLEARPFHKGDSYRVVAACEQCGYCQEF